MEFGGVIKKNTLKGEGHKKRLSCTAFFTIVEWKTIEKAFYATMETRVKFLVWVTKRIPCDCV